MHRPLSFDKQPARLVNFNPRAEKHGPERKPAGDVFLSLVVDRSVLAAFDPVLPDLLFLTHSEARANPDEVEALEPRLPFLQPLRWDQKYPGYGIAITFGLELLPPIDLVEMQLSDFVIEAQKGGTARLALRASGHPTTEQSGELCALIQQDVIVSLIPPKVEAVAHEADAAPQGELLAEEVPENDPAQKKTRRKGPAFIDHALVTGIELKHLPNQLTASHVTCSDQSTYVLEWADEPTLDEIAARMHDELGLTVEYAPAARQAYEAGDQAAAA